MDITGHISSKLKERLAGEGACLIYTPHTTAGLTINEGADPDVMEDVLAAKVHIQFQNSAANKKGY